MMMMKKREEKEEKKKQKKKRSKIKKEEERDKRPRPPLTACPARPPPAAEPLLRTKREALGLLLTSDLTPSLHVFCFTATASVRSLHFNTFFSLYFTSRSPSGVENHFIFWLVWFTSQPKSSV